MKKKRVLSFNPCIEAGQNFYCPGGAVSDVHIRAIKRADAVILPQSCPEDLYRLARRYCEWVLPNLDAYFDYPGKTGQARLFRELGVPHPRTLTFRNMSDFERHWSGPDLFPMPFVFKASSGGEGRYVFLVTSKAEFHECLDRARQWERSGMSGFLIQEFVPNGGRSLRVVVIGNTYHAYWRVQRDSRSFYTNIAKGAYIDRRSDPDLIERAVEKLNDFCSKTGINLAGFDFLFSENRAFPGPIFLEINYFFRKKGLGGPDNYFRLLEQGVREWICSLPD